MIFRKCNAIRIKNRFREVTMKKINIEKILLELLNRPTTSLTHSLLKEYITLI